MQRVSNVFFHALLAAGLSSGLWANPVIYPHSVINGASFQATGLPSGSIAQGSLFTIFGAAMGPATAAAQTAFPLQNTVSGVGIQVSQGATFVNAIPLFVSAGQINAIMPSNTPLGWVSLRVTYQNALSNPSPVYIVHDSPGIFTATGLGLGPAAAQNVLSASSLPLNSNQDSVQPGHPMVMYLTGLGPITGPDSQPPPPGNLATLVEVWVGGVPAQVAYSGRSPCCAGIDQINFMVPANAPQGCWTPLWVRTSHATISNFTSIAVNTTKGTCSDTDNPFAITVANGGALGELALTRITVHEDLGVNAPVDITNDFVSWAVTNQKGGPLAFTPWHSAPPPGTCTVYQGSGDFLATGTPQLPADATLDGGNQVTVTGSASPQTVTLGGGSAAALGSYLQLYSFPNQLFLSPGSYTANTSGGADIGPLKVSVTIPSPLTWTNRDETVMVPRTQPLMVNWTGTVASQIVVIMGVASDLPTNSSAVFECYAPSGASSFTVPPEVLGALPASRSHALWSKNVIYVISSSATAFTADGLTSAAGAAVYATGKTVAFQ